jgi:hypothetical protein
MNTIPSEMIQLGRGAAQLTVKPTETSRDYSVSLPLDPKPTCRLQGKLGSCIVNWFRRSVSLLEAAVHGDCQCGILLDVMIQSHSRIGASIRD